MTKIYALYKGDKYITDGTRKEIAEYLGIKEKTVMFYGTPTYQKRCKGNNNKKVICIGKE